MSAVSGTFQRRPGIVARQVAGETLLVPIAARAVDEQRKTAELFVLNETGEFLWELLATPTSLPDLARNLMKRYDVAPEQALADATDFLTSLREAGLLQHFQPGVDADS